MSELLDIIEPVEDISLWALDETGKRLESNNQYFWGPKGKSTFVERNGSHKGINIVGATEIKDHFNFVYNAYSKDAGALKASHIIQFMDHLLDYDRKRGISKTMIILDNAKPHIATEVKEFALLHENDLVLIHQPPYSPELNPQENMWNWLKSSVSEASAAKNVPELLERVQNFRAYITSVPDKVKKWLHARNFFK
jgi:hypothetical protein